MESVNAASTTPVAQQEVTPSQADVVPAKDTKPAYPINELDIDGNKIPVDKLIETYKKSSSLDKASYQRFQEASAAKKEAEKLRLDREAFKKRLAEDFEGTLQEFGLDPLDLSEKAIQKKHKELTMSDEERKMSAQERELMELRKLKEEIENRKSQEKKQQFRGAVSQFIDTGLGKAFDAAGLDPDAGEAVVFAAANHISKQIDEGTPIQYIDFDAAVTFGKQFKEKMVRRNPEKELEEIMKNPELAEKARQYLLKNVNPQQSSQQKSQMVSKTTTNTSKKYYSPQEFRDMMESEAKNG